MRSAKVSFAATGPPPHVRAGTDAVSLTAAASGFVNITYSGFDAIPAVVATAEDSNYFAAVSNRTTTGCRVYVQHRANTALTVSIPVCWQATAI